MKNVPEKFVNTILEANAMLPSCNGGDVGLGDGNHFHMPGGTGEGTGQDQENQGKGSGDGGVTDKQDAGYQAASNAGPSNDTFSHEAEQVGGEGSPEIPDITTKFKDPEKISGTGLPENIGNVWSMPKPLNDHVEVESAPLHDDEQVEGPSLQERVEAIENGVASIVQALTSLIEESADPEFTALKQKYPKKPGESGVAYVTRLNTHRTSEPAGKPAPSLQKTHLGNPDGADDAKTEKMIDKVTKGVKPASDSAAKKAQRKEDL